MAYILGEMLQLMKTGLCFQNISQGSLTQIPKVQAESLNTRFELGVKNVCKNQNSSHILHL